MTPNLLHLKILYSELKKYINNLNQKVKVHDINENILYTYKCMKCKKVYKSEIKNIIVKICDPCGNKTYENMNTNTHITDISYEE